MKIYKVTISDAHLGYVQKWASSMVEAKRIAKVARDEYDLLSEDGVGITPLEFPTKKAEVITWLNVHAGLAEALSVVIRGVPDTWEGVQKAKAVLDKAKGNNNG